MLSHVSQALEFTRDINRNGNAAEQARFVKFTRQVALSNSLGLCLVIVILFVTSQMGNNPNSASISYYVIIGTTIVLIPLTIIWSLQSIVLPFNFAPLIPARLIKIEKTTLGTTLVFCALDEHRPLISVSFNGRFETAPPIPVQSVRIIAMPPKTRPIIILESEDAIDCIIRDNRRAEFTRLIEKYEYTPQTR